MTDLLDDVWSARDLPVLVAAARLLDQNSGSGIYPETIASAIEMDSSDVNRALVNLQRDYLDMKITRAATGQIVLIYVGGITGEGLRAVGAWPSAEVAADRLVAALDEIIDNTTEGSPKQSKLKAARDSLLAAGRDVLVEVAGAAITGRLPLP